MKLYLAVTAAIITAQIVERLVAYIVGAVERSDFEPESAASIMLLIAFLFAIIALTAFLARERTPD